MPFADLKVVLLKVNAVTDLRAFALAVLNTWKQSAPRYAQETAQKTSPRTSPQSTIGISYPSYYVSSCAIYILDAAYLLTSRILQLECWLLCCVL